MMPQCKIGDVIVGGGRLALIGGPCMAESRALCLEAAAHMAEVCRRLDIGYIFKASYDKANRSSAKGYRGPGLEKGLTWLADVRRKVRVPVLSDVHEQAQCRPAGKVLVTE